MALTQNLILRVVAQWGEISSVDLAEVGQKFGLSPDAVRAAANRMARSGMLAKMGRGRGAVRYKVGQQGQVLIRYFISKTMRWHMALEGQLTWGGDWLVVTFSIPEGRRSKRDAFRTRLEDMGFGLLHPSVWISPFDQEAEVTALVEELDLAGHVTLLRCQSAWVPGVDGAVALARRVWKLDDLEAHYRDLNRRIQAFMASLGRAEQGEEITAEELLFEAMNLQNELLEVILVQDPCLPDGLLPSDWPSQRTHELIHVLTRLADQLDVESDRYEHLFHLIRGMEVLEAFRTEGDDSLRWPGEEARS